MLLFVLDLVAETNILSTNFSIIFFSAVTCRFEATTLSDTLKKGTYSNRHEVKRAKLHLKQGQKQNIANTNKTSNCYSLSTVGRRRYWLVQFTPNPDNPRGISRALSRTLVRIRNRDLQTRARQLRFITSEEETISLQKALGKPKRKQNKQNKEKDIVGRRHSVVELDWIGFFGFPFLAGYKGIWIQVLSYGCQLPEVLYEIAGNDRLYFRNVKNRQRQSKPISSGLPDTLTKAQSFSL